MSTALFTHPACLGHQPGSEHPERPARLEAIAEALAADEFESLERREAPAVAPDTVALAHPAEYVKAILDAIPATDRLGLDPDTVVSPGSGEAALRAVGAVCAAVDAVIGGEVANAFCAVRPPGHHAEPQRPMGFCLFNNVAVGALHGRAAHGLQRVAVIDFDVHHGNGTQAMFEHDRDLFYASTHQWPLYPGTGAESETGVGNIFNQPLARGAGSAEFRAAMDNRILPAIDAFEPELIMISAGFDAHANDPLADLNFRDDDYAWVTRKLLEAADRHARGRLVSTLEGGYDLKALASSCAAHVRELMAA